MAIDLWVLACALGLAYVLRFDFSVPHWEVHRLILQLPVVLAIEIIALYLWGIYSFIWRYVGVAEVESFAAAGASAAVPLLLGRFLLPLSLQEWKVPLSIIVLNAVFGFLGIIGVRLSRRLIYERFEKQRSSLMRTNGKTKHVLLVGAGRAGILAAREIRGRGDLGIDVIGFVDDDPLKKGTVVNGIKVLGATAQIPELVVSCEIDHVIITIAQASRKELRRIVDICETVPVRTRIIPGLYEILDGRVEVSAIRDVQIEDLLGREPVQLDRELLRSWIGGKTVLVSGAGGSIGSELVRQILQFEPKSVVLVERSEFSLYSMHEELLGKSYGLEVIPRLADIGDEARMREVLTSYHPDVVLHAAAHKHVPLVEWNPLEAVKNNVLGTRCFAQLAGQFGVKVFVLISTDKAVNPTSVMGATKRMAELIIQDLGRGNGTRYVAVRFGNVLGSTGSVVPKFRSQIAVGGPVTVTDPEMRRYFMTIPEAAQLVLQAGAMGEGGEIFILDMGDPIRISDLARDMIRLSGFRPEEDVEIVYTGCRPGEKLFEELDTSDERVLRTRHPKVLIGRISGVDSVGLHEGLRKLEDSVHRGDVEGCIRVLARLVPEADLAIAAGLPGCASQTRETECLRVAAAK